MAQGSHLIHARLATSKPELGPNKLIDFDMFHSNPLLQVKMLSSFLVVFNPFQNCFGLHQQAEAFLSHGGLAQEAELNPTIVRARPSRTIPKL
jgi:hypothetical protein